jgi:hypothetical protein
MHRYSLSGKPCDVLPAEPRQKQANTLSDYETNVPDPRSRAQLDLLCRLIGKSSSIAEPSFSRPDFKLSLFDNENDE